jgi:glycosyltransferase involved in cell wall biosynthesis
VAQLCVLGYIVPEVFKFPGEIAPGVTFASVPNGIAAIEALAAERALVATDIPEFREVASEGGVLVPQDDPEALARACLDLWHDHDRRLLLARRGRAVVAGRTWESVATAQGNVYQAVMRGTLTPGNVASKNR